MIEILLVTNHQLFTGVGWRRLTTDHDSGKTDLLVNLGHPLLVFQRGTLASEDDVHLLETQALRLGHKEPDEGRSNERDHTKENVCSVGDVFEEIRGDLSNDEVVHPVGRATERSTVWASADGPDLSNQNPCARSPRVAEVNDEEPDHNDSSPTCSLVVVEVVDVLGKNNGNDQVRNTHADCANCKDGLTADTIDVQYSRD